MNSADAVLVDNGALGVNPAFHSTRLGPSIIYFAHGQIACVGRVANRSECAVLIVDQALESAAAAMSMASIPHHTQISQRISCGE